MNEPEYRQDDRTIGYCPICGQTCTDTMMDGGGWCPDHGRIWVNWSPPRAVFPEGGASVGQKNLRVGQPGHSRIMDEALRTQTEPKTDDARELGEDGILDEPSTTASGSREGGASDPRPDPRTHPEYWTE